MSTQSCILCGARDPVAVLEASPRTSTQTFRLLRCAGCGLVHTDPRLTRAELEAHYGGDYWGETCPADLTWVRRDQRHRTGFLGRFRPRGRILDVGCGLGLFLLALDPTAWDRYGLEPMPLPYAEAARQLGANRILHGELTEGRLRGQLFDVITFWDVLEHLPNPRAALEETYRLLEPGGLVLLTLPNFAGYQARRFGADWYALSLPHHLYHFTPATLERLLEATGFCLRALEQRFGREDYHALKHSLLDRLTRRHGPRAGRLRYYLLKPFLHPWEWLSTRFVGGSHLAVCAERRETV